MAVYTTTFPANENPISEGGKWFQNNVNRAQVLTTGGNAFGTGTNNDGYAYLAGFGDSVIETTIFRDATLSDSDPNSYEVEHLHRLTDDAGNTAAYELDFQYGGGFNIVRWSGGTGFAVLSGLVTDTNFFPDGAGGQLRDGYKIKTELISATSTINIYADSGSGYVLYFHYVLGADTTNDNPPLSSGDPAIGFFTTLGSSNLLGLKDATITSPESSLGDSIFPDSVEDLRDDIEPWDFVSFSPLPADTVMSAFLVYDSSNEQEWPRRDLNDDELYGFELWLTPADTVMSAYLVYDSTLEQEQPDDESFGFEYFPVPPDVLMSLGILYDSSSEQEQPDDEDFGFSVTPLSPEVDFISIEDASWMLEQFDEEDFGIATGPLLDEIDYILSEDGSWIQEEEDLLQDFLDNFVVNNVVTAVDFISVEDASWMQEDDEAIIEFIDNFVVNNPNSAITGHVIVFYDGLNVANGLNYHKDLSRPIVILTPVGDGTFNVTKVTDVEDERVGLLKETVTIDGDIP